VALNNPGWLTDGAVILGVEDRMQAVDFVAREHNPLSQNHS
jgi:hypothetical protein